MNKIMTSSSFNEKGWSHWGYLCVTSKRLTVDRFYTERGIDPSPVFYWSRTVLS